MLPAFVKVMSGLDMPGFDGENDAGFSVDAVVTPSTSTAGSGTAERSAAPSASEYVPPVAVTSRCITGTVGMFDQFWPAPVRLKSSVHMVKTDDIGAPDGMTATTSARLPGGSSCSPKS